MRAWGTRESHRREIADLTRSAFAEHTIVQEGNHRWWCGRRGSPGIPASSDHSFRVLVEPRLVVLWGDVGTMLLEPRGVPSSHRDTLDWLRRAVGSPEYLLSKDPLGQKRRTFLPGEAQRTLAEYVRAVERRDRRRVRAELVRDVIEEWTQYCDDGSDGEGFARACHDRGVGDHEDWASCWDRDAESWWCAHALSMFVELLKETG